MVDIDNNNKNDEKVNNEAENMENSAVNPENEMEPGQMVEGPHNDALEKAEEELTEMKDKYLRLYSDFENFRKRMTKERSDLLKTAKEEMMVALLPVMDDFARAKQSIHQSDDVKALREGVDLIFNKLNNVLTHKGLKPMESIGQEFNSDLHEAISKVPAPSEEMKGKIIDEVEPGYFLQDKVIRYAKVIVGV